MSEFSESYHLRGSDINEAAALLRRTGLKGYVFPPSNGWISFVAEQNSFEPDPRVVAKNTGTLLHYVSAEDHGWNFSLFEGAELACGYGCNWDEDVQVDDSRYSAVALSRALGSGTETAIAAIERVLHPVDIDEAIESQPSQVFAQAMVLPRFEWFAYDYVSRDFHDRPGEYVGVVHVA
jgi:hypothetical protein